MAKFSKKLHAIVDPVGSAVVRLNRKNKFGQTIQKGMSWGYMKKKLGLNKLFGSPSSAVSFSSGDVYGHSGSIVGKY